MISIIICSINPKLLSQLRLNIRETIGVDYQVLAVNNAGSGKGICEVYNTAVQKAAYPVICFCHEDIRFVTNDWGQVLLDHFNSDSSIGLIGVAGGDTKGIVPSGWFTTFDSKYVNIAQGYPGTGYGQLRDGCPGYADPKGIQREVLNIDGVFMCTKKDVMRGIRFDDELLKGFHGYDIDFSLQIFQKFRVIVIYDLLIQHFSEGKLNREWMESTRLVTEKWKRELPISSRMLSFEELTSFHWKSLQVFLEHRLNLGFSASDIWVSYFRYTFSKYFSFRRAGSMARFVLNALRKRAASGSALWTSQPDQAIRN